MQEEYNRNYNVFTNKISEIASFIAEFSLRPHSDTRADDLIEPSRQLSAHIVALKTLQDRRRLEIQRLESRANNCDE